MPVIIQLENGLLVPLKRGARAVIGRDPHLEVSLPHPRVSRQHAEILYSGDQWILRDLQSANGTFVDGSRVTEVYLESTVSVRLGGDSGPELTITTTPELTGHEETEVADPTRHDHLPLPPMLKIGAKSDNHVVVRSSGVLDFQASVLENARGFHEVVDTTGLSQTAVNGLPVMKRKRLEPGDVLSVGDWAMRYTGNALEKLEATGGFSFVADNLRVIAGEKVLLDGISFQLRPRTLTAVIGPSGSGKSTLLGALTGRRPATHGDVFVGDLNLYDHYDFLRSRIGLVPQSDLLHTNLTTQKALEYAAALRFPRHVDETEQLERVDEVIELLGLQERRHLRIDALSGGQRKRASVALELLTEPELLFLDEPTSGLDPGLDRQVMNQLRDLANGGRTVLVVTHTVANLDVCDEVIVLAPGGKLAYHGAAHNVLSHFGAKDWAEVFDRLGSVNYDAAKSPGQRSRPAVHTENVTIEAALGQRWISQLSTLISRYLKVISSDKYFLILLGALPFVLAMVGFAVGTDSGIAAGSDSNFGLNPQARPLILVLILGASFMGLSASVQELVKERTIYDRERSVGLSASAYLLSKVIVLGTLVTVQTTVFVTITLANRDMPPEGVIFDSALTEVLLVTIALGLASMLLGLLISAVVNSSEVTMPALVLTTMGQVVLSGAVPIRQAGLLDVVGLPNPGYWAMNAIAVTADLNEISGLPTDEQGAFWAYESENWFISMGVLAFLTIGIGVATRVVLARREK